MTTQNRLDDALVICRNLVTELISKGYSLSVWEGENYACKFSTDVEQVIENLGSTDENDILEVFSNENTTKIGEIVLILDNGKDVICDHSANETMTKIMDEFENKYMNDDD